MFQTELVNHVYTPFLRGQISGGVLLTTDLYERLELLLYSSWSNENLQKS
jgi:hypothetical protein